MSEKVERCRRCDRTLREHGIYFDGPIPETAQAAVFEGLQFDGLYCLSSLQQKEVGHD